MPIIAVIGMVRLSISAVGIASTSVHAKDMIASFRPFATRGEKYPKWANKVKKPQELIQLPRNIPKILPSQLFLDPGYNLFLPNRRPIGSARPSPTHKAHMVTMASGEHLHPNSALKTMMKE